MGGDDDHVATSATLHLLKREASFHLDAIHRLPYYFLFRITEVREGIISEGHNARQPAQVRVSQNHFRTLVGVGSVAQEDIYLPQRLFPH